MAAKGSVLKEEITNKILECFPGSFRYDKEIRIPGIENSENLQIKITLTCAKVNVENGGNTAVPGAVTGTKTVTASVSPAPVGFMNEPTAEEKQAVADLVSKLGLS